MVLYLILTMLCDLWDLSSPSRDRTHAPALGVQSPNHWTTSVVCLASGYIQINSSSFLVFFSEMVSEEPACSYYGWLGFHSKIYCS